MILLLLIIINRTVIPFKTKTSACEYWFYARLKYFVPMAKTMPSNKTNLHQIRSAIKT